MNPGRFVNLSAELAKASFKQRNEGSYLGILWYLLNPVLTFIILYIIFSQNLGANIPNYYLYLLIGILMSNLFQRITSESTRIIEINRGLIKSLKFQYETLPFSVVLHALFSHIFEIAILIIILIIYSTPLYGIIFYPIVLFFFCLFSYGLSLFLSSLTVYITDLDSAWQFISRMIWLATPIFYLVDESNRLFGLILLNPLYFFLTAAREIIIYQKIPELWIILGILVYSLFSFIIGYIVFKKLKTKFAELI